MSDSPYLCTNYKSKYLDGSSDTFCSDGAQRMATRRFKAREKAQSLRICPSTKKLQERRRAKLRHTHVVDEHEEPTVLVLVHAHADV